MTPAGRKLLERFIEAEQANQLRRFVDGAGNEFFGIPLQGGNGGETKCAYKLAADGLATLKVGRRNWDCCFNITDAGRAALASN